MNKFVRFCGLQSLIILTLRRIFNHNVIYYTITLEYGDCPVTLIYALEHFAELIEPLTLLKDAYHR